MSEVKGKIVIIKRSGQDRVSYPLVSDSCLFGSGLDCDIRVQLPSVSERHCVLKVGPKDKVYLTSFSHDNITLLNNIPVSGTVPVNHKDILTVVDRCFRFEYTPDSAYYVEDDSSVSVPAVKSLKVLSPREKPPLFQVNGIPGKTSSAKKKLLRKSLGADIHIFSSELSPLSRPRTPYLKKNSTSPRSMTLSSSKHKRVSFGPALSPEQFDKNMPPATPVRRGSLPRRHATTPDYFGSPIITQYPRLKKKRLSAIPKEQSIAEEVVETSEAVSQSPRNKYNAVSPKSQSPSAASKSSPKTKGGPIQMLQQTENKKAGDVTRKSPLAKKSPKSASQSPVSKTSKSVSPVQSPVSSAGKGKMNRGDADTEVAVSLSSSLSDSPQQTVTNAKKVSPFKSKHNTPKQKVSPSNLSPVEVWSSVISPSTKQASPLSRRKSSIHSSASLSSLAVTPRRSLKTGVINERVSSSGKRSSSSHAVKRLSSGKSPARPVSLSTPNQKSPLKTKKQISRASEVRYSLPPASQSLEKESSLPEKLSTDDFSSALVSGSAENSSFHVITPRSSLNRQLNNKKLSSSKMSPGSRILKRLSAGKSPAHSPSPSTPIRRASGKLSENKKSSSKLSQSFLFMSASPMQEVFKNETSQSADHLNEAGKNDADTTWYPFSDQAVDDSTQSPVSRGRRSESRATPKSSSKRQSSVKQSLVTDTLLTPESGITDVYETSDAKQVTPVGTSRMSRSPVAPKSTSKSVSSALKKTPVSASKTPVSKRKADFSLSPESVKKTRLSASPSSKLSTPSSKASPKSQSLVEARSNTSPKELLSKPILSTPIKKGHSPSPKPKASADKTQGKTKSLSLNSKNKTPVKISPQMKSSPSLSKENKTPVSKNSARSKVTPSSVKTRLEISAKASPLAKSPSSAAKRKFSTPAKKVTPITKRSSVKKAAPTSRSLRKSVVASSPSQLVQSPARSVRKVFSSKKSSKKPMWTEIVRRGIMKKKVTSKPKVVRSLLSNAVKTKKAFKSSNKKQFPKAIAASNKTIFAQIASVTSTGHAESPETIVIRKRSTLPKPNTRDMGNLQSPTPDSSIATNTIDTSSKLNLSHSSVKSRKSVSSSAAKTSIGRQKDSPDISSISTPNISQETFVSPLTTPRVPRKNNSYLEKYVQENQHEAKTVSVKSSRKSETFVGVKRLLKSGTPKADYSNVAGIKRLVHTPRASPKPDYCDVGGIKKLVQTPKDTPKADYRDVRGVRRLVQTPKDSPKADYRDVRGIRRLVQTPKDSPKADYRDVRGIKRLVQTPKDSPVADYRDVDGVKDLLTTPASAKRSVSQAKTDGMKQLYQNHTPLADYTKVKGVKQLFKATRPVKGKARTRKTKDGEVVREPDFTNVEGVKQLFREPEENEFNISGLQQLFSPVPSVPFSAKTDIVSPATQDTSPLIQKISSPRSRRKQSFGSSPAFKSDNSKKPLQITSVPQENAFAADHVIDMEDVVISPSTVKEVPGKILGSANKAVRSTRRTIAIPVHEQTPDPLHSPSGRKSVGTAMPLDTSLSGKSPKVNKPGKSVTSPSQSVMTTRTPSMSSPKTRQQTPQSATDETHDRKNSLLQKQRRGAGSDEKSDAEADKITSPSAVQSMLPVSTFQRAKRGRKNDNVNRTPEIIVISDDEDEVALSEQNPKRGGRSNSKQTAIADKGSKKGVDQEVSDLVESQQAVRQISPRKNSRAVRSQTIRAAETSVADEAVPNDLSGGRRATRSKASEVKKMVGSQHTTGAIAPKGGRGTRGKKNSAAADEVPEHTEKTSDSHDVGGRASRRKMVASPEPVDQSSTVVVSPTKVDKRNKTKKFLDTEIKEDSLHFSGDENNEVNEVKGSRRTRGKGQAVGTPVKRTSQSVVHSADENKAGRVTRRGGATQTTTRQNVHPKADSLESRVEDSIADIKALPHQGNLSTTPSRRRVNKQKQDNSTSRTRETLVSSEHNEAVADTPSPAKSFKTRKNRKLPASSEDGQDASSKTDYEAVAASEKSKRSKNKMLCKSDDTSQVAESVKGNANVPSISKAPRSRRNQKILQEDVTPSSLQEDGETLMGTRRSKRGHQQETENVPQVMPKQPRTRDQKYGSSAESSSASIDSTDMSDAVRRTTRGKTVKSDTSCESTEVPDASRPKKQSKKSNVNKGDDTASQMAANKTASVSSKRRAVGSPSSQNVVKKGQVNNVDEVPPESERPKRVGRATRGVTSVSSDDNDVDAVNSKRSRAKRSAVDSANDAVSPKRTRKTVTQKGVSAIEETTRTAKVQPKPSKTQAPVLEAIPEVEEEIAVTPTVKKVTRAKASVKETTKKSPLRRPTRSRRK